MTTPDWHIDPDIPRARTLPAAAYSDEGFLARVRERVFARSWQMVVGANRALYRDHFHRLLTEACS